MAVFQVILPYVPAHALPRKLRVANAQTPHAPARVLRRRCTPRHHEHDLDHTCEVVTFKALTRDNTPHRTTNPAPANLLHELRSAQSTPYPQPSPSWPHTGPHTPLTPPSPIPFHHSSPSPPHPIRLTAP